MLCFGPPCANFAYSMRETQAAQSPFCSACEADYSAQVDRAFHARCVPCASAASLTLRSGASRVGNASSMECPIHLANSVLEGESKTLTKVDAKCMQGGNKTCL